MLSLEIKDTEVRVKSNIAVTRIFYEIGKYNVDVVSRVDCDTLETVADFFINLNREKATRYTPEIFKRFYTKNGLSDEVKDLEIQTSSYGSLKTDEIRYLIDELEESKKVVEYLKTFFKINPDRKEE